MKQGEKCAKIEYEPLRQSDDKVMSKMRCVPQTSEVQNQRGRLTKCSQE